MFCRATSCWIAGALAALCFAAALAAQESSADVPKVDGAAAVEEGREALSDVAEFPWYDQKEDRARALHVVPRDDSDSANRGSQWTNVKQVNASRPMTGFSTRRAFSPILQWIGLSVLIVLLGVIAFMIAKTFLKEEASESTSAKKVVQSAASVDRVEALPVKVRGAAANFLDEARRLYEAGDFSEAILYLFSHELVALDTHRAIRLAKGKTNRQYLRELRQRPPLRSVLETTMIAFEDVFFGRKSLSRERFEECWRQLAGFERELEPARAA